MTNTCLQVVHLKEKPNKLASMFFTLQKALVPLVDKIINLRSIYHPERRNYDVAKMGFKTDAGKT
jgi:hypothetical protein